jgi:hypothetical protein
MLRKILVFAFVLSMLPLSLAAQEATEQENTAAGQSWFQRHYANKIHLGYYSSYYTDNIYMAQAGYEAALKLIDITPTFNLIDVGIGLNALIMYDMVIEKQTDHWGHTRYYNGRSTYGFELNWNVRLFCIPITKINARVYIEGCGMSLVVYSQKFPDTRTIFKDDGAVGTVVNIGTYIGLGMDYPLGGNNLKGYTTLRWYHTSNGKVYEHNPGFTAIGIVTGLQF